MKFTPEGGRIQIDVAPDPSDADMARVSVSDSGIGMRDDQVAHVWERFYQGDASAHARLRRPGPRPGHRAPPGAAPWRHRRRRESGPGQGSTFWFSLPLLDQPATAPRHTARTAPPRAETPGSQSSDPAVPATSAPLSAAKNAAISAWRRGSTVPRNACSPRQPHAAQRDHVERQPEQPGLLGDEQVHARDARRDVDIRRQTETDPE